MMTADQRQVPQPGYFSGRAPAILAADPDAVLVFDGRGKVIAANPAAERAFGRPRGELLGRDLGELLLMPDGPGMTDHLRDHLSACDGSALGCRLEVSARRAGGTVYPAELTVAGLSSETPPVYAGFVRDLTGQRQAIADLRAADQRYRLLFERNVAGVLLTRPDGAILDCNDALVRMLGYSSRAELIGRSIRDSYLDPSDRVVLLSTLRNGGQLTNREIGFRRRDGKPVWVLANVSRLTDGPGGPILHTTLVDLTERKKLEEQYRQAQKMEVVGRLAGGVAHDFNNLLTVINGFSELAIDQLPPGDSLRGLIEEVLRAGERAAGLTRQLLAFSRRQVLAPRVLDLNGVITEAQRMLRRVIGDDILLTADLRAQWPIHADAGQIEQVLMNLVVNARDAMPTGGTLALATADVELSETSVRAHPGLRGGRFVVLAVSDTGVGMTDDVKNRMFEPFFTTKQPGQGTGLGLATVYGIIQQSGGQIEVDTLPGHGTTFRLYLPRAEEADAEAGSRGEAAPVPRGSETVLVVEDEPAVRAFTCRVLQAGGYDVLEAGGVAEAMRVVGRHGGAIHLLVTDVVMAGLGGRGLAELLAAEYPDLSVLYLSGYTDDDILRHGVMLDEVHFLHKPFAPEALARAARAALDAVAARPSGA
jgi:PAS domain S-box-containing protein